MSSSMNVRMSVFNRELKKSSSLYILVVSCICVLLMVIPYDTNVQNVVTRAEIEDTNNVCPPCEQIVPAVPSLKPPGRRRELMGDDEDSQSPKRQLMLLTMGRSGSTYTSAIISNNPKVFYVAEPLHRLPDGIKIYGKTAVETNAWDIAKNMMTSFLTCNIGALDPEIFESYMYGNSRSTRAMYFCLRNRTASSYKHVKCVLSAWNTCLASEMTFIKTIRLRVQYAEWYLEEFPNLKLLFLVRDPRAVLYSQSKAFGNFNIDNGTAQIAESHCNKLRRDIAAFKLLSDKYPGRMKAFRYEDGALNPMDYAESLFNFTQLEFNEMSKTFVQKITSGYANNEKSNAPFGFMKKDSTATMNKWRHSALMTTVTAIDRKCADVYAELGYKTIHSESELRSSSSLTTVLKSGGIFTDL
ncbi:carbohydrate sulfotransferase 5 [Aplysia californica]|uniref:Carbohydrate sulfotransferase 5 n=1 Tax=Aplysia californica TaxID=6500 RepID=A0ABM0JRP8_APLCA|nr:carbohydrate sulfotransferase 5 [Aplysia californica]